MAQPDPYGFVDVIKEAAPVAGPLFGGLFGWVLARAKHREDIETKTLDHEKDLHVTAIEATNIRFQTLMDGYEQRIDDLTTEVHTLREEIKLLRKALDQQTLLCGVCGERKLRTGDHDDL